MYDNQQVETFKRLIGALLVLSAFCIAPFSKKLTFIYLPLFRPVFVRTVSLNEYWPLNMWRHSRPINSRRRHRQCRWFVKNEQALLNDCCLKRLLAYITTVAPTRSRFCCPCCFVAEHNIRFLDRASCLADSRFSLLFVRVLRGACVPRVRPFIRIN